MNINLYNVLSHLIPGFMLYLALLHGLKLKPNYLDPLMSTAVAYMIGFFINSISAWLERFLNWTWGGKPSEQLLQGKNCGRIKFYEYEKLKELLQIKIGNKEAKIDELFGLAMRITTQKGRIEEMNAQYSFSRTILIAIFISSIILGIQFYDNYLFWIGTILLILISWYRTKERGFYYAREVLKEALNKLEKEIH